MRFVILEHDHPHLHWDLMLESGDVLRTWRLAEPLLPGVVVSAEPLGNHRRQYLDYEGPVSGNRGQVQRWDAGTFSWVLDTPERLVLDMHGQRVQGRVVLEQTGESGWQVLVTVSASRGA